jgi:hypothetical protein
LTSIPQPSISKNQDQDQEELPRGAISHKSSQRNYYLINEDNLIEKIQNMIEILKEEIESRDQKINLLMQESDHNHLESEDNSNAINQD